MHELGHALRVEAPALWEEMATDLRPLIERWGEYRETLSDAHYAALSADVQFEDLMGDVIGQEKLTRLLAGGAKVYEKPLAAQWVAAAADADGIDLTSIRSARDNQKIAQQIEKYNVENQGAQLDTNVKFSIGPASKRFVSILTSDKAGLDVSDPLRYGARRMKAVVAACCRICYVPHSRGNEPSA